MAQPPEYVRYSIYSQRDTTGAYDIPSYEKDLRNIVNNAIKSALPKDTFYHVGERQLAGTGRERIDVFVHRDTADFGRVGRKGDSVLEQSLNKIAQEITFKGSPDPKYHITKARPVSQSDVETLAKSERDKEVAENTKQLKEGFKDARSTWLKIVAVVATIADITRRILSSLVTMSQEAYKDTITAHNLGVNYNTIRTYKRTEQAHGLREGTLTQGATDVQSKFGNITALDTKAVDALAVVMGGKVEDMIKVATSEQNPDKAMGMILDSFMERANQGYNSVGQYVGEAQARRELYSYLLKISPAWADIFATMQEEQHNINSIFREQAGTFESFKNSFPSTRGGHGEVDYNNFKSLAAYTNEIKTIVSQIKESIGVGFAATLLPLMRRLAQTRLGMSERERIEANAKAKAENQAFIDSAEKTVASMSGKDLTQEELGYKAALEFYIKKAKKENAGRGNIYNVVPLPDEVVSKASGLSAWEAIKGVERAGQPFNRSLLFPYVDKIKQVATTYLSESDINKSRDKVEKELAKNPYTYFSVSDVNATDVGNALNDPDSPFFVPEIKRFSGDQSLLIAGTLAKMEALLGSSWSSADWEDWNAVKATRNIYKMRALALKKKWITSSGGMTPTYSIVSGLKEFDEDAFWVDLYKKYQNTLESHLDNLVAEEARAPSGDNIYYDLAQLYRGKYGDISGTYSARFFDENQNGVIVHKIVLDYNNNGKPDASDLVLESWQNDRPGYTGTAELRFENGRLSAIAPASSEVE